MTTERTAVEILVTTELQKAKADLKDMHSSLKNIESAANTMGNALKTGLAFFGLDKLVGGIDQVFESTLKWDEAALTLTDTMNENATAATTWLAIGKAVGIESDVVQRYFTKLSQAVNTNSAILRGMNIATVDSHGKFLALGQVVNQLANYFEAHQGATNNAALAQDLFGRGGAQLLPILELGSAGIQKLSDHFRALGYVVNGDVLQGFAQADAQVREGQMAVQGLAMAVTHALMPGLAALSGGLTDIIESKMEAFKASITSVVSFVIGFFEGLTGGKATMSDTAVTLGKVGAAVKGYGDAAGGASGASNALADAEKRVREQAKAATDAINEQIRSLENMTAVENFADQQRKLHAKLIDDNKKVDELYSAYQTDLLHGYEAQAMDQLVSLQSAQQTAADDSTEIDKGAKQEQRRTLIDTLREQEKAINASADKQIAAMQRAAAGSAAAIGGVAQSIPGMFDKAGAGMGLALNKASEQAGKDMAANFQKGNWHDIGEAIGKGIMAGIGSGLGKGAQSILEGAIPGGTAAERDLLKNLFGNLAKFISANPGEPSASRNPVHSNAMGLDYVPYDNYLTYLHQGERVVPAKENSSGRGATINIYINGADSPERTGQAVADRVGALLAA